MMKISKGLRFLSRLLNTVAAELEVEAAYHAPDPPTKDDEQRPKLSLPLPFRSEGEIAPGENAKIEMKPQFCFRGEKIVLEDAEHWTVQDILVGRNSQFVAPGGVPGRTFAADSVGVGLSLETIIPGMILSLIVRNDGKTPAVCSGVILGTTEG